MLGLRFCARAFSPVAASGGHSSSWCAGLSLSRPLLLRSTGSRRAGSVVVAHGPSRSTACGIFPDQDSNPCPLHWQADSPPLHHQGSPRDFISMDLEDFWFSEPTEKNWLKQKKKQYKISKGVKRILFGAKISVGERNQGLWGMFSFPSLRGT